MTRIRIAGAVLACLAAAAVGDDWVFPKTLATTAVEFGKSKIILEVDGTKNPTYPAHKVLVYLDGELKATLNDVGYEKVFASTDNHFFVGLSNRGIPGTAFVVFDANGKVIRKAQHGTGGGMPATIYTRMSVTLVREWYDAEKPDVAFEAKDGELKSVFVNGSNGQRYDLLKPGLGFDAAAATTRPR